MSDQTHADANKLVVLDFFREVFEGKNPDAVVSFVADDFVQHATHVRPGREGLEAFVREIFPDGPQAAPAQLERPPLLVVAEGDLVVIAAAVPRPDPDSPGATVEQLVFDAFRLRDGMLVEHWSSVSTLTADPQAG